MAGSSITAAQIHRRGYTDLGIALMRENTAFTVGNNSPIGNQNSNGMGAGQSFVSLLGLGSQRTLTLVDGMRVVGAASASPFGAGSGSQVDVSDIPISLIKRIDTKLGGAGAAYGADAVAGVVNYQLDDHFKGVDINAQGNWTQNLDEPQERVSFKAGTGFDHDRGGVVFDFEWRQAAGLLANQRPDVLGANAANYNQPPIGSNNPYNKTIIAAQRGVQATTTGIPMYDGSGGNFPVNFPGINNGGTGILNSQGQNLIFSQNGKALIPLTYNRLLQDGYTAQGGNGYNPSDFTQLYTPSHKYNFTTLGHYDITDHIHATWQAWYVKGSAASKVPSGIINSSYENGSSTIPLTQDSWLANRANNAASVVNGPLALNTNNPYLTADERSTIMNALSANGMPTNTFYMSRMMNDLGLGMFRTDSQMMRFQGGLNGDFKALNRQFNWSLRGVYGRYIEDDYSPSLVIQNFTNALNATTDAQGQIICAPGYSNASVRTGSSSCSPLNPFGYNQMSEASRDYVIANAHSKNINAQRDLQAEINSTLFHLPAGNIRWDLGYEHRREGYNYIPGSYNQGEDMGGGVYQQYGYTIPMAGASGSYYTHEAFGELDIPLIAPHMNIPGVYNLSATANGRFIHNSVAGNYWTYMFGGSWWFTSDVGISGNYAQSVRNPSVTELFSPLTTGYDSGTDPCSDLGVGKGPNPAIRAANCAASGMGTPFHSNINYNSILGTSGGNSHLRNEVSDSYTLSMDLHPHFVHGFNMTTSFVDVKVKQEVNSLGLDQLMAACYDSRTYCDTFTRDSNHQVTGFSEGYFNIGQQHMRVLQTNMSYFFPLRRLGVSDSFGSVLLSGNYSHYLGNTQVIGQSTYQLTGTTQSPKDLFTLNFNYMRGPLTFQWQTIWNGPSHNYVQVNALAYEFNKRPSFAYYNMTIGYDITKNISANFMINNITNAMPKYPRTVNMSRYFDALIGRSFQMNVGVHF
ncbi:TonB-dependent receptor [Swingsia samuiensis]|uniref:TonB-dependent receptor n=2 Tax=Swingsia samuiensis TaxID=1293412 RepID=A0A4Y6ULM0_9PROT|nr:TonB-dependent receptor [Swingsia samuiensis]